MFGIFSKKRNKPAVADVKRLASERQVSTEEAEILLVEQIHKEFYTASDNALAEAKSILDGADKTSIERSKRLAALGFSSAAGVKEGKDEEAKIESKTKMARNINYFNTTYPLHKYISAADVKTICAKYNLVAGPVSRFIGHVPTKNLAEIEQAPKVEDKDCEHVLVVTDISISRFAGVEQLRQIKKVLEAVNNTIPVPDHRRRRGRTQYEQWEINNILSGYLSDKGAPSHMVDRTEGSIDTGHQLLICAPAKDFNLEGATMQNGFFTELKSVRYSTTPAPDPVVLRRVTGGFLIVTAWGPEASDPLVVNQKMN
jgi:hypothetical protein